MSDLVGNPEDRFSQNEAQLFISSPGMGCSCLQVTFQACCIEEARYLYDQLTALCPILVSLDENCYFLLYEPLHDKTGLKGIRPGSTQTRLYSDRRWLEA